MQLLIVVKHSEWGTAKFEVKKAGEYVHFFYSDGQAMGWWDRTGHGSLSHPNKDLDELRRIQDLELCEMWGDDAYEEWRRLLRREVEKVFPDFLYPEDGSAAIASY